MRRIHLPLVERLYDTASTRRIEQAALAILPPHSLMARAGAAVAHLALALTPHARRIWVACGPGNNGGDGLVAATELYRWARSAGRPLDVVVTLCADPARMPPDAAHALAEARAAGLSPSRDAPETFDLAIDALLGIGALRAPEGTLARHLQRLQDSTAPVLCIDLPSGLDANTGACILGPRRHPLPGPRHTLSLLTLKPGLFTADGRDQAGTVWLDSLGVDLPGDMPVTALLQGGWGAQSARVHAAHKGLQGDVLVIGGQSIAATGSGMTGAAVLAARAALHAGAGRVYLCPLGDDAPSWDPACPELMVRRWHAVHQGDLLERATVVCGCGGGQAVAAVLPTVLQRAGKLVLDADGLNHVADSAQLQATLSQRNPAGRTTVITPHPLEAARLLGQSTAEVMADRLASAQALSLRYSVVCVLKGSGTVISAAGEVPRINASGNAALATAGTGDVLAGIIGATLAAGDHAEPLISRVARAVHLHGWLADQWINAGIDSESYATLTADALARAARPI